MRRVPGLDLEPVDESAPEVADHRGIGRRAQIGIAFEALEQHVEAVAEIAGAEIGEAGRLHRLCDERVAIGVPSGHRMRSG